MNGLPLVKQLLMLLKVPHDPRLCLPPSDEAFNSGVRACITLLNRHDERTPRSESVLTSTDHYRNGWNEAIDRAVDIAECADPNDGRDHDECPFCTSARVIRQLKVPQ